MVTVASEDVIESKETLGGYEDAIYKSHEITIVPEDALKNDINTDGEIESDEECYEEVRDLLKGSKLSHNLEIQNLQDSCKASTEETNGKILLSESCNVLQTEKMISEDCVSDNQISPSQMSGDCVSIVSERTDNAISPSKLSDDCVSIISVRKNMLLEQQHSGEMSGEIKSSVGQVFVTEKANFDENLELQKTASETTNLNTDNSIVLLEESTNLPFNHSFSEELENKPSDSVAVDCNNYANEEYLKNKSVGNIQKEESTESILRPHDLPLGTDVRENSRNINLIGKYFWYVFNMFYK